MNKQQKALLNFFLMITGAAILGWLVGKLIVALTIWLINSFGATFLTYAALWTSACLILVPTAFGIKAALKADLDFRILEAIYNK